MKNQRTKTNIGSRMLAKLAIVVLMIATLTGSLVLLTSAASNPNVPVVSLNDLVFEGDTMKQDASGMWYKVYDGTTDVGTVTVQGFTPAGNDQVTLKVDTATYNAASVNGASSIRVTFKLEGADKDSYRTPDALNLPAYIVPKQLTWAEGTVATAAATYKPGANAYTANVTLPADPISKLEGFAAGEQAFFTVGNTSAATINGAMAVGSGYKTATAVTLAKAEGAPDSINADNYTVDALNVNFTVEQLVINKIEWILTGADGKDAKPTWTWSESAPKIEAQGTAADGETYILKVLISDAGKLAAFNAGDVGAYTFRAYEPDANFKIVTEEPVTKSVEILKKVYDVTMEDATYIGNANEQSKPDLFRLLVQGKDVPANILNAIKYYRDGKEFIETSEYGYHKITAKLPESPNYEFRMDGKTVKEIERTLCINRKFIASGAGNASYNIVLIGNNGFSTDIEAIVTIPEISAKAVRDFKEFEKYTLKIKGGDGELFTALISISDTFYHKYLTPLRAEDIYVYEDANGKMIKASDKGYTVAIKDGYIEIGGVKGNQTVTFVIAPEYNAPFFLTPWGIAILVFIALLIIALLCVVGLYLRRIKVDGVGKKMDVDSGEPVEPTPAVIEEKVDLESYIDESLDAKLAELADTAAETDPENTEGTDEACAEAMATLMEEVSAIVIEPTTLPEELAEFKAEELAASVEAEDDGAEADEDVVRAAVAVAMAENFNESADAEDAIALEEIPVGAAFTEADIKAVIDSVVSDAMVRTVIIPEQIEEAAEEVAEEIVEEATEAIVEETVEEPVEEPIEIADTEEVVEETAEEVVEKAEAEPVNSEDGEITDEKLCAYVTESVETAFEVLSVDGITPTPVEGISLELIVEAVEVAAEENIPEDWTEDMIFTVKGAVSTELAERLLRDDEEVTAEEEAVETFAEVTNENENDNDDDDDDEDEDDDDEGGSFGGYGSMPLNFIDVIAEAEQYAEMLEQEARGEVQIVTRYRRSFQSRLIQSQGNVQDYYNILKNTLLSYKGVKGRISWNYESFNRGRMHLVKLNAKTRTLYMYIALNPEELADTKYGIVDVSSKKKYATVPVLMKIKGDRKFKYALELVDKLCGEDMTLPKLANYEETDYRTPYQTTEQLVEAGVIRKYAASIPVTVYGAAATEEAPIAAASATAEAQEVSFVEPTTAPAVEEAVEEITVADVAADAPADEENKQI